MRVLVLGGTAEARALAQLLVEDELEVLTSLAGRVERPRLPVGDVRTGGFGGVAGLASFLSDAHIETVVDATHPFAREISAHAVEAVARTGTPLLRLARPGWGHRPDASSWQWVDSHAEAAAAAAAQRGPVLLTTGRQPLPEFVGPLSEVVVVARVVDEPEIELPATWTVRCDRGPYTLDSERTLMTDHGIRTLVTKDSGGSYTEAKLDAARELGIAVVVVRRPFARGAVAEAVTSPEEAARWVRNVGASPQRG